MFIDEKTKPEAEKTDVNESVQQKVKKEKEQNIKKEKLKTINYFKQIYSKEEWNKKKNKISLRRIMNS